MRALLLLSFTLVACGVVGDPVSFERSGAEALGSQRLLVVSAPIELRLVGAARSTELSYTLEGTLTASTTETAERLAEDLDVEITQEDSQVSLTLTAPSGATLSGTLALSLPADLNLEVTAAGPGLWVQGVSGDQTLRTASSVRVEGAEGDLSVSVNSGNAILYSALTAGTTTQVEVGAGSIQLFLPAVPSVRLRAVSSDGQIVVEHPRLPATYSDQSDYSAVLNGGQSQATLYTRQGSVVLSSGS